MGDAVAWGKKRCSFKVIDGYNREILSIEVGLFPKEYPRPMGTPTPGKPLWEAETIRMNNGSGFIAKIARVWPMINDIEFQYIQSGPPECLCGKILQNLQKCHPVLLFIRFDRRSKRSYRYLGI